MTHRSLWRCPNALMGVLPPLVRQMLGLHRHSCWRSFSAVVLGANFLVAPPLLSTLIGQNLTLPLSLLRWFKELWLHRGAFGFTHVSWTLRQTLRWTRIRQNLYTTDVTVHPPEVAATYRATSGPDSFLPDSILVAPFGRIWLCFYTNNKHSLHAPILDNSEVQISTENS